MHGTTHNVIYYCFVFKKFKRKSGEGLKTFVSRIIQAQEIIQYHTSNTVSSDTVLQQAQVFEEAEDNSKKPESKKQNKTAEITLLDSSKYCIRREKRSTRRHNGVQGEICLIPPLLKCWTLLIPMPLFRKNLGEKKEKKYFYFSNDNGIIYTVEVGFDEQNIYMKIDTGNLSIIVEDKFQKIGHSHQCEDGRKIIQATLNHYEGKRCPSPRPKLDEGTSKGITGHTASIIVKEYAYPMYSNRGQYLFQIYQTNGEIRLCVDYRSIINKYRSSSHCPLPRFEELLNNLQSSTDFSTIDLKHAYLQMVVDEDSRRLPNVVTHKRYFRYKGQSFGISTRITQTDCYLDDIMICRKNSIRTHRNTCGGWGFFPQVTYLGHAIDAKGIKPLVDIKKTIKNQRILCKIRAYVIPTMKTALSHTKHGDKWEWTEENNAHLKKLKSILCSKDVLVHFDEKRLIIGETSASQNGIGAAILQTLNTGETTSVIFASRNLSQGYSYNVLFGKIPSVHIWTEIFTDYTPSAPLDDIYADKAQSSIISSRLTRWQLKLSGYHYEIQSKKSNILALSDGISRLSEEDSKVQEIRTSTNAQYKLTLKTTKCIQRLFAIFAFIGQNAITSKIIKEPDGSYVKQRTILRVMAWIKKEISKTQVPLLDCPWEKLHLDFSGPIHGKWWLVILYAHSKWIECFILREAYIISTKNTLNEIFARCGILKFLVTDNGLQFTSKEFANLCLMYNISHFQRTPYHSRSNGAAETAIRSIKYKFKNKKG
ncbi:hypothetical protein RF11_04638 [Thelohanellus kitauei]|uniref:Integrase catalytic domain-containing protein n=1 Tax=Thelohanellus kitauei TaxID=669202 RepID=A0A0C2N3X8_THEKT|nr:hypothetical protein RF11_04638 [Thelohanellus kitauei]